MLTGLLMVSAMLLSLEVSTGLLKPLRSYLEAFTSPIYLLAESPYLVSRQLGDSLRTHDDLTADNQALQQELLELKHISQQFAAMKAENDRLRELLGSQGRGAHEVLIAELVGLTPRPDQVQMILDKGAQAGVETGQAVLDAQGLVGQVVNTTQFTSRVLVLTDPNHAVPVQVNRNGVRSIAGGTGGDLLLLENVPLSADIVEGDMIETSGIAGRFPRGYPVGRV
ncbi:MAG: rod shape-determining protein MreC, partial [Pseudomonadota bacterium]